MVDWDLMVMEPLTVVGGALVGSFNLVVGKENAGGLIV